MGFAIQAVAVVAVALALAVAAAGPKSDQLHGYTFEQYTHDFGKVYTKEEAELRRGLFERRLAEIKKHNANPAKTYRKGVNHLTDRTDVERQRLNGAKLRGDKTQTKPLRLHAMSATGSLPVTVDHRNAVPSVLTAVKDQGQCGSCWAHSAVESIESQWAVKYGQLYTLSQQQITSCTPNPNQCGGTGGCGGNIFELAWDYVVGNGGITQEWDYSYTSYWGMTPACRNASGPKPYPSVVKLTGYIAVPSNDQRAMMDAVATVGPISIVVDASEWGDYEGGVFTGCGYGKNITIDHGVQLVGYGHDYAVNLDYWIVRNSWSPGWGENGFIRIARYSNDSPGCGWNNLNDVDGIGCEGQPNTTWACGECGITFDAAYPIPQ